MVASSLKRRLWWTRAPGKSMHHHHALHPQSRDYLVVVVVVVDVAQRSQKGSHSSEVEGGVGGKQREPSAEGSRFRTSEVERRRSCTHKLRC